MALTKYLAIIWISLANAGIAPAQQVSSYIHQPGQSLSSKDLEELCKDGTLKVLDLRASGTRDTDLKFIAQNRDLEELRLDSHTLTTQGYQELAGLNKLKILGIEAATAKELESVFEMIKDFPLEELDVSGCRDFNAKGLDKLNCQSTLKRLDVSCFRGTLDDKGMPNFEKFTALTYLNLNGHSKIKAGISSLEGMTELVELECYECVGLEDQHLTPLFAKLKKLKKLNLGFCWWHEGKGLVFPENLIELNLIESKRLSDDAFSNLPCKSSLVNVNLFQCLPMTDKGVAVFQNMPQLRSFNVGCIRELTNESLKTIGTNTGLTHLNFSDNDRIDDSGLSYIKDLRNLEVLNIWHTKGLTGSGLANLEGMDKLIELNLADCHNLDGKYFEHIKSLKSLQNLYLDNCISLKDDAFEILAEMSGLKELTIRGCERLTDKTLTQLASLKSLEYLDISSCVGFTDPAVRALRKALPDCEIVR